MPRLFTAIPLPDAARDRLSSLSGGVVGARWLDYDQLHMTLVFLGNVADRQLPALREGLRTIRWRAFALAVRDLGVFPSKSRPRVIWAGIEPVAGLVRLQRRVAGTVAGLGIDIARRKYHPHVTLARLKRAPEEQVALFLGSNSGLRLAKTSVTRFELWQSHLAPEGASYSVVDGFDSLPV